MTRGEELSGTMIPMSEPEREARDQDKGQRPEERCYCQAGWRQGGNNEESELSEQRWENNIYHGLILRTRGMCVVVTTNKVSWDLLTFTSTKPLDPQVQQNP